MRFDRQIFFDGFRERLDPTIEQVQVDGLEFLLGKMEKDPFWKFVPQIAYALATVFHETAGSFQPVEEGYYLGSPAKIKRFQRSLRYHPYFGRGYVQLTWKRNYERADRELDTDLTQHPEKALEPETAYRVMTLGMHHGWFTGKKLDDFIKGSKKDYVGARKIINGTDKAGLIAGYARSFEKILAAAQDSATPIPAVNSIKSDEHTADSTISATQPEPPNISAGSTAIESTITQETGDTTATVTAKNEQDVNEPAVVAAPEPYNGIGFWATIKRDFYALFGANAGINTVEEFAQRASGWPEWVVAIVQKLVVLIAAGTICYFIFRVVHYAVDTWKKHQKAKTEALVNSDITRKNIKWEQPI